MALPQKVIPLPTAGKPKRKPRNMTSDGRRCVRVDAGYDPATGKRLRKAFYGKTLKEAQAKADEYRRAVADGVDLAARDQSVAAWVETWLDVYGRKGAPSTVAAHEFQARHMAAALGALKLSAVRPVHVQRYADSLSHLAALTVRNYRNVTQSIFRQAVHNRILTYDPTQGVSWGGQSGGTHRALTSDEIALITEHWREHPVGPHVMIMLFAGLRRGEALGLRWEDVDYTANLLHVRRAMQMQPDGSFAIAPPKTASSVRDVPILPFVRAVLDSLPHDGPFVLPQYVSSGSFGYAFHQFVKHMAQYAPGFTLQPHDLRHTFATLCYDASIDVKSAQDFLGHANPSTTLSIYTHLSAERKLSSADALAAFTSERYGHQMGITPSQNPRAH